MIQQHLCRICAFTLLFLLTQFLLTAQAIHEQQVFSGIAAYRAHLLSRHAQHRHALAAVKHKLDSVGISNEVFMNLTVGIDMLIVLRESGDVSAERLKQVILKNKIFGSQLDSSDIEVLVANADLFGLMGLRVLESTYPYKVDRGMKLHEELKFYHLEDGLRIADIGTGNGEFCVVLGFVYENLDIACNEIDSYALKIIERKRAALQSTIKGNVIHVVEGTKTSVNLPAASFDRIIIRNTFHHFARPLRMLESIAQAMADDGMLLINEPVYVSRKQNSCKKTMKEKPILRLLSRAGFVLDERLVLPGDVLYRFTRP